MWALSHTLNNVASVHFSDHSQGQMDLAISQNEIQLQSALKKD